MSIVEKGPVNHVKRISGGRLTNIALDEHGLWGSSYQTPPSDVVVGE